MSTNNILLIGSGMMSEAVVQYLLKRQENRIMIASNILKDAEKIASQDSRLSACFLDVMNEAAMLELVKPYKVVISYIPAFLHLHVAKACLAQGIHLVTSSYISPEMKAMEPEIKEKNLIFLNECGLDPGIDHLLTMQLIHEAKQEGGKITDYISYCGGLPCPDVCDNPLGYKFSWSPLGALNALRNDAKYLENNEEVVIPSSDLLYTTKSYFINQALNLECYANRDSIKYLKLYGLDDCQSIIRGTLRYKGFSTIMAAIQQLGLMDVNVLSDVTSNVSMSEYLRVLLKDVVPSNPNLNEKTNEFCQKLEIDSKYYDLANQIAERVLSHHKLQNDTDEQVSDRLLEVLRAFKWLEFFSETATVDYTKSPLHNIVAYFETKLIFKEGERDAVYLQNVIKYDVNGKKKTKKATLLKYGESSGLSAMAFTVGTPTAIAVQLILDGQITTTGVNLPNLQEISQPIMEKLNFSGLSVKFETE